VRCIEGESEVLPPYSDKAILPSEILSQIIDVIPESDLPHPLIFKITSICDAKLEAAYIGVREFSSPESDLVILPRNIFRKLSFKEDITLELVDNVSKAKSLKLLPKHNYNILNWKFFLENSLSRFYTTLSTGDLLVIEDNSLRYELDIEEINGSAAPTTVSIIDTDVVLDIPASETANFEVVEINSPQTIDSNIDAFILPKFSPTVYKVNLEKFDSVCIKLVVEDENIFSTDIIAGLDKFLNMENFYYSTMDDFDKQKQIDNNDFANKFINIVNDDEIKNKLADNEDNDEYDKWLYVIAFSWDKPVDGKLIFDNKLEHMNPIADQIETENTKQCLNCLKLVANDKFLLHQSFCLRNNVRCERCNTIFLHKIPESHWHCPHCDVYGNNKISQMKHMKMFHDLNYDCACGVKATNFFEVVRHKSTDCPLKLHQCRFCHMILPQGMATYIDKFENLTNHENQCGNKTTECYKCNKIFRLKDIRKHLRIHDLDKQQFNLDTELGFRKCSNENCINELKNNDLELCDLCYGPLYIQDHDPNKMKLQQRLERKYMLQLTKGCGNEWCNNEYCAQNVSIKQKTIKEKLQLLHDTLFININHPKLPINKTKTITSVNKFWFCVNESMLHKLVLFAVMNSEDEYAPEMIYKAISQLNSEEQCRAWLSENAIVRAR
jgi:hypothetical protein